MLIVYCARDETAAGLRDLLEETYNSTCCERNDPDETYYAVSVGNPGGLPEWLLQLGLCPVLVITLGHHVKVEAIFTSLVFRVRSEKDMRARSYSSS